MRAEVVGGALSKFNGVFWSGMYAMLCVVPATLWAQEYDNPSLGQQPVVNHTSDFKPLGVRAGSFMLHPGVELATEFNDNILYAATDTVSDTIFHIRPYITAQSNWSRHSLNFRLAADIARYSDFGFRDYEDYFANLGGRVDVKSRSSFNYALNWMQLHEDRNVRSAEQGIKPTEYTLTGGSLGYDHTFNRLSLGILFDLSNLAYKNNLDSEGELIDNSDRDRNQSSLELRAGYQFQTDKQAFVSFVARNMDYDQEFDRNGLNRDSDGYTINGGINFSISGVLSGDLYLSYHDQSYDSPELNDVSGFGGGAGLTWTPTTLTTVRALMRSSVEQTTVRESSGYLRTLYTLRADHELLRNLQINGMVSYTNNDYQLNDDAPVGARSEDNYWSAAVGATYFINRAVYLSASYNYVDFTSNVPNDDFNVNRFWLVLGLER